jgi:hypothetical protein
MIANITHIAFDFPLFLTFSYSSLFIASKFLRFLSIPTRRPVITPINTRDGTSERSDFLST